ISPGMHTKKTMGLVASVVIAGASAQAFAQSAPAAPAAPVAPANTVAGGAAAPASPASADPNIDRGFVLPTAMTQPARTLTYSNYEIFVQGLTVGITDRVQVSVTAMPPISDFIPYFAIGSAKWRLLSVGRLHLALQGSVGAAGDSGGFGSGS